MQFSNPFTFTPDNAAIITPDSSSDFIRISPVTTPLPSLVIQMPDAGNIPIGTLFWFHFDQPVIRVTWLLGAGNSSPDTFPTMIAAGQTVRLVYVDQDTFLVI